MKKFLLWSFLIFALSVVTSAAEPKILFIGNPTTDATRELLYKTVTSVPGLSVRTGYVSLGHEPLQAHWERVEKDFANPSVKSFYRFSHETVLKDQKWDYVVLAQDDANCWKPESFFPYAENLVRLVRLYAPDAEPVFQQNWSVRCDDPRLAQWGFDSSAMFAKTAAAYKSAAEKLGMRVVPVGAAVELARKTQPQGYKTFNSKDFKYPDKPDMNNYLVGSINWTEGNTLLKGDTQNVNIRGKYLQACVWFAFLFNRNPEEIRFVPDAMTEDDCKFLRTVAKQAVAQYPQAGSRWKAIKPYEYQIPTDPEASKVYEKGANEQARRAENAAKEQPANNQALRDMAPYIQMRDGAWSAMHYLRYGNWHVFMPIVTTGNHNIQSSDSYPGQMRRFYYNTWGGFMCSTVQPGASGIWDAFIMHRSHMGIVQMAMYDLTNCDYDMDRQLWTQYMEAMIRYCVNKDAPMVLLYSPSREILRDYAAGKTPWQIEESEKLAQRYGCVSCNLSRFVADQIKAGNITEDEYFAGPVGSLNGTIASEKGLKLLADGPLKALFLMLNEQRSSLVPLPKKPVPEALFPPLYCEPNSYDYELFPKAGASWKEGCEPILRSLMQHNLVGTAIGDSLTIKFKGSEIGVRDVAGPDSAGWKFKLDGGDWKRLKTVNPLEPAVRLTRIAAGLDPEVEHEVILAIDTPPAGATGCAARLGKIQINGKATNADRYPNAKTAEERREAMNAEIGPFTFPLDKRRFDNIPKTMAKLRGEGLKDGELSHLKIVLWGNSITQNTYESGFYQQMEKMYPKCKITAICSWRSATLSSWYNEDPQRIKDYVIKYNPDLLIIDGSLGDNKIAEANAKWECVKKVKAMNPNIEILQIGPYFSSYGRYCPEAKDVDEGMAILKRMCEEEKIAWFDTYTPWYEKTSKGDKYLGWYKIDGNHTNARGSRLLGMMFERWFDPEL